MRRKDFIRLGLLSSLPAGARAAGEDKAAPEEPLPRMWFSAPVVLGDSTRVFTRLLVAWMKESNLEFNARLKPKGVNSLARKLPDKNQYTDIYREHDLQRFDPSLEFSKLLEQLGNPDFADGPYIRNHLRFVWQLWNGKPGSDCRLLHVSALRPHDAATCTSVIYGRAEVNL